MEIFIITEGVPAMSSLAVFASTGYTEDNDKNPSKYINNFLLFKIINCTIQPN